MSYQPSLTKEELKEIYIASLHQSEEELYYRTFGVNKYNDAYNRFDELCTIALFRKKHMGKTLVYKYTNQHYLTDDFEFVPITSPDINVIVFDDIPAAQAYLISIKSGLDKKHLSYDMIDSIL